MPFIKYQKGKIREHTAQTDKKDTKKVEPPKSPDKNKSDQKAP